MKYLLAFALISTISSTAAAVDQNPIVDQTPSTVSSTFKNIFIPKGFDSNDNVQVMAEGVFGNSCFKVAPPIVNIDETNKRVTIDAQAYHYRGICMQMQTPFQQVVDLGIIKTPGKYTIQNGEGKPLGAVEVAQAKTAEPDDHFYAPVQRVSFVDGPQNIVHLRIEFSNSCLKIDEVKVTEQDKVIVIQPIVKFVQKFGCAMGYFPVTEEVKLSPDLKGRYLLHVRSSGSQASNNVIAIQ